MNRIDFLNSIYEKCTMSLDWDSVARKEELLKYARKYQKETKKFLSDIKVDVINGCLYFDNKFIARIEWLPAYGGSFFTDKASYYEGAILARQEAYID